MKLLLDQGLPRSAAVLLSTSGTDTLHVGDIGLAAASDPDILARARKEGRVVVTLDADFHMLLALSGAIDPSVVRIRIEGLRAEALTHLLLQVLRDCEQDLKYGALVAVLPDSVRVRRLPIA